MHTERDSPGESVRGSEMATQAALRDAAWDVAELQWAHGESPISCVFRRVRNGWEPWIIVAESAIMRRAGVRGLGLYAARTFRKDDYVGRYDGHVVGVFASREAALASPACRRLVMQGHDKLITRRPTRGSGVELVDGVSGGPPFLHRMNDPRGTSVYANVELTPGGWVQVVQRSVSPFDLNKGVDANIRAELRLSYGEEYWAVISRLGTRSEYAIEID